MALVTYIDFLSRLCLNERMKVAHESVEAQASHHPVLEGDDALHELPHVEPSAEKGHWEVHNPENPHLTPASRIKMARVAFAFTDKYPHGWHFEVQKETGRDRYGRIVYFVPDPQEVEK